MKNAPQDKLTRRVYNLFGFLATGQELAETVTRVVPEARLKFEPDPKMIELVMNLPERLDDTLARQDWGWNLRYDLERSVRDMVADVRAHRHVYEQ